MEKETLKTDSFDTIENRSLNASFQHFDLPVLIDEMKHGSTWTKGNLNAMILSKKFDNQVVLTQLVKGAEIKTFQSNDSISIYLIEGKIKVIIPKKSTTIKLGQFFMLRENIKYRLKAEEDTVFLLIISNFRLKQNEMELPWCI